MDPRLYHPKQRYEVIVENKLNLLTKVYEQWRARRHEKTPYDVSNPPQRTWEKYKYIDKAIILYYHVSL